MSETVRERVSNALLLMHARDLGGSTYARESSEFAYTCAILNDADIALEGVPGVGKTSLARDLAAAMRAQGSLVSVDFEERDDDVLDEFFKSPATYGFFFQLFKLKSRHARIEARRFDRLALTVKAGGTQNVHHILDRTLPGDMAFAFWNYVKGNFTIDQLRAYMRRATSARLKFPKPALLIYLSAPPALLVERVRARGIAAEVALYDEQYFRTMDACYRLALEWSGCHFVEMDHSAHFADGNIPADVCMALLEGALVRMHSTNLRRLAALDQADVEEQLDRVRSIAAPHDFIAIATLKDRGGKEEKGSQ